MSWLLDIEFVRMLIPVIDIGILTLIIYHAYKLLVKTQASNLVRGALGILMLYGITTVLQLETMLWILNILGPAIVIGIIIIFQPEFRKIFVRLGQGQWFNIRKQDRNWDVEAVMNASTMLSSKNRGALIVFPRKISLQGIIETGTPIDAELGSSLIITIFGHDTPLHDGAMVIDGGKIVAAGCMLPLSQQSDIRRSFGTRHRAALGLAEESDAIVLVVSEETGAISLAYEGNLHYDLKPDEVTETLKLLWNLSPATSQEEATYDA